MLNPVEQLKLSEYAGLYDRIIPENHILRKFNELVDFDFIYEELEEKYCLTNGRIAISPILLFKYLILKVMYNMSDRDLVDRSRYDMSFTLSDCVRKTTSSTLPRSPSSASCASRTATFSTSCSRNPSKSLSRTASSKAGTSSWMPRTPKRATT